MAITRLRNPTRFQKGHTHHGLHDGVVSEIDSLMLLVMQFYDVTRSPLSRRSHPSRYISVITFTFFLFSVMFTYTMTYFRGFKTLGPVVRTPVSANLGLNFNPGFFFFLSKALSRIVFSIHFRVSNHPIVDKEN